MSPIPPAAKAIEVFSGLSRSGKPLRFRVMEWADLNARQMWSRVKAEIENGVLKVGFHDAYALRPGSSRVTSLPDYQVCARTLLCECHQYETTTAMVWSQLKFQKGDHFIRVVP